MSHGSIIRIGPTQLGVGVGTLYTADGHTPRQITHFYIANTNGAAVTADIHLVPSGGSATATNLVIPTVSIPANDTLIVDAVLILFNGDTLQGKASTTGVIFTGHAENHPHLSTLSNV